MTEYDYGTHVWWGQGSGYGDKSKGIELLLAAMSMGSICSELGIGEGWKYLSNGSVKGKTDYVWFMKYEVNDLSATVCAAGPNYFSLPYYEIPPPNYDEIAGGIPPPNYDEIACALPPGLLISDENVQPAVVQLYRNDKIRLCGFNDQVVQMIVNCLQQVGGLYVQNVNDTDYIRDHS